MKAHPHASLFPKMSGAEFDDLDTAPPGYPMPSRGLMGGATDKRKLTNERQTI